VVEEDTEQRLSSVAAAADRDCERNRSSLEELQQSRAVVSSVLTRQVADQVAVDPYRDGVVIVRIVVFGDQDGVAVMPYAIVGRLAANNGPQVALTMCSPTTSSVSQPA
jgi:hypothetical protein